MDTITTRHEIHIEALTVLLNAALRTTACFGRGLRARQRAGSPMIDFQYSQSDLFQSGFHLVIYQSGEAILVKGNGPEDLNNVTECNLMDGLLLPATMIAGFVAQGAEEDQYLSTMERDLTAFSGSGS